MDERAHIDDEWAEYVTPSSVDVEVYDPDVVGTILGPDGEPLHDVLSRSRIPFGFNRS